MNVFHPFLYLILVLLVACSVTGQVQQKRMLPREDYHLWHQLLPHGLSEKGNWMGYTHHYESNADTLFVAHTSGIKTFAIAKGSNPEFIKETHLVYQLPQRELAILNLRTGKTTTVTGVDKFAVAASNYLVQQDSDTVHILNLQGVVLRSFGNVKHWKVSPESMQMGLSMKTESGYALMVVGFRSLSEAVIANSGSELYNLEWQRNGRGLAFLQRRGPEIHSRGAVFYYDLQLKKAFSYTLGNDNQVPDSKTVAENYVTEFRVSDDGKRIFFGIENKAERPEADPAAVEVWNTADKSIYIAKAVTDGWQRRAMIAVWWPHSGKCMPIHDEKLPYFALNGDQTHTITSNPEAYEPQFKYNGDRDYYITDLETGMRKLFLTAQSGNVGDVLPSPGGRFVAYFRNGAWWIYDIAKGIHRNLTETAFTVNTDDNEREPQAYTCVGFTENDRDILVYDRYDLWRFATDGSKSERLTCGRETGTVLRLVPQSAVQRSKYVYDGMVGGLFDLSRPLYLRGVDEKTQRNGIYIVKPGKAEKTIVERDRLLGDIMLNSDKNRIVFTEQDFDLPPQLLVMGLHSKPVVVGTSNRQQERYHWGKSALITFEAKGKTLGGVLLYPANFDGNKKYPMVVHVYEKQAQELHLYVNPTLANQEGFNATDFTQRGYFVFLPDMFYEVGNTGHSAVACMTAAVQKVVRTGLIDTGRIGLIGHSYGGFATNYIMTQDNPFCCAVSGAGTNDLVAGHLYIAKDFLMPNYAPYESGQMRMGKPLFEAPERYLQNTPILKAAGIHKPLLLWVGKRDSHVDATYTFNMHMALRRLKRESVLLAYPEERHTLLKRKNQEDLTLKVGEWFDCYLKDRALKDWMKPDYLGY